MTRKISIIIFILIAVGMGMAACDDDPKEETPDPAKDQTATITNLFGEGYEATVKGTLTNAEWNGVADKIETAINDAFTAAEIPPLQNIFRSVFERGVVKITVEKAPVGYTKWKTSMDGKTMFLAFDALDTDLQVSVDSAFKKMEAFEAGLAQVKNQNRVRFGGGMSAFELAQIQKHGYVRS